MFCWAAISFKFQDIRNDLFKLITRNDANMSKAKAQFYKIVKAGRKQTYNTRFRQIKSSLAEKYPSSFNLNAEN